jgi:hypothetical protein
VLHDIGSLLRREVILSIQKVVPKEKVDWQVWSKMLALFQSASLTDFRPRFRRNFSFLPLIEGIQRMEDGGTHLAVDSERVAMRGAFSGGRPMAFKSAFNKAASG